MDKNNDTVQEDLLQLLSGSRHAYVQLLFPHRELVLSDGEAGKKFDSISAKFQGQLGNLMVKLGATTSNFIRCIKPNGSQAPDLFQNHEVMVQLRYSGMCAALDLLQHGFPTRIAVDDLHARYAMKLPPAFAKMQPKIFAEALLVALGLDSNGRDFQMGLTKVFFSPGKYSILDELASMDGADQAVVVAKVRKWLARKTWRMYIMAFRSSFRYRRFFLAIRALRKFRRLVRVRLYVQKFGFGLLKRARKRLYSDAELAKRAAMEASRLAVIEAERAAHDARVAEELRVAAEKRAWEDVGFIVYIFVLYRLNDLYLIYAGGSSAYT